MSSRITPRPWQPSQRASRSLAVSPRPAASAEPANAPRSGSSTPRNPPGVWMPDRDWSAWITRSGAPSIRSWGPGLISSCATEVVTRRGARLRAIVSIATVDLPEPETPHRPVNTPSGSSTSSPARLFAVGRRRTSDPVGDRRGPRRRPGGSAARTARTRGAPVAVELPGRAGRKDPATPLPCARSDDDQPIDALEEPRVVVDEDDRVARVAQLDQRVAERIDLPRVKPARRLVEEHRQATQFGAEERGELDPLRLTGRQCPPEPIEMEMPEADAAQEPQPARRRPGAIARPSPAPRRGPPRRRAASRPS